VILTGRNADRLKDAAAELGALSSAAFDATDEQQLEYFFDELQGPIDHLMLSGSGPYYAPLAEMDFEQARQDIDRHVLLPMRVARHVTGKGAGPADRWSSSAALEAATAAWVSR
jgi:NADP-dependent 3-hydroxy acid dehydrogenase YdfG